MVWATCRKFPLPKDSIDFVRNFDRKTLHSNTLLTNSQIGPIDVICGRHYVIFHSNSIQFIKSLPWIFGFLIMANLFSSTKDDCSQLPRWLHNSWTTNLIYFAMDFTGLRISLIDVHNLFAFVSITVKLSSNWLVPSEADRVASDAKLCMTRPNWISNWFSWWVDRVKRKTTSKLDCKIH